MPLPTRKSATSSLKLLQLLLSKLYVAALNLVLMSSRNSLNMSSGISVDLHNALQDQMHPTHIQQLAQ